MDEENYWALEKLALDGEEIGWHVFEGVFKVGIFQCLVSMELRHIDWTLYGNRGGAIRGIFNGMEWNGSKGHRVTLCIYIPRSVNKHFLFMKSKTPDG